MPRAGLLSERRKRELSNGFGAKWFRVIGELEDMIEKALEIKQRTLFGKRLRARIRNTFCRALRLVVLLARCGTEDWVIRNVAKEYL